MYLVLHICFGFLYISSLNNLLFSSDRIFSMLCLSCCLVSNLYIVYAVHKCCNVVHSKCSNSLSRAILVQVIYLYILNNLSKKAQLLFIHSFKAQSLMFNSMKKFIYLLQEWGLLKFSKLFQNVR